MSFLLENLWLVLRWAGSTCPSIHHELETELARWWEIEMNVDNVPDAHASAAAEPARGLSPLVSSATAFRQSQLNEPFLSQSPLT